MRPVAQGRPRSRSEGAKRFWCKVYQTKHDLVCAICDKSVLGKTLSDGRLEVKVSKSFYGGVLITAKVASRIMSRMSIGNLMGRETVDLALEGGFITEENLIVIDGVPHAQFVKVEA